MGNSKIKDIYKMTPMQQGMFFYSVIDGGKTNYYCNQEIFKLNGILDQEMLEKSFKYLVDYYDIFRTIFRFENGEKPLQIVLNKCNFNINFYDVSNETDKEKYFKEKIDEDFNKGFDLTREIAIRVSLYKMNTNSYNIVWTYHHIILDGWSIGIIYKDLINIYSMLIQGQKVELPKRQNYKNYIEWLEKKNHKQGLEYWNDYLKGYDTSNLFDINKKIEVESEYKLQEFEFELGTNRTNNLVEIAKKKKVTVNAIIQVVWGILLQKCNNTSDVVYGTVTSGRTNDIDGIEEIAGLFINTIPVRVTTKTDDKFSELLNRTNIGIIKSKEYEYLPLIDIQGQSIPKNNLINHIIVYENFLMQEELSKDNKMPFNVEVENRQSMTNYDFNFIIYPSDKYKCRFSFNSNVYESEFIENLSKIFVQILDQVVLNLDIEIDDIELLSENQIKKLIYDFNDTNAQYPKKTIHELFEEQVKRTPNNIAVKYGEEEITYDQLNRKANSLARTLIEKDVKPDDIIGIMLERSIDMIVAIIAILKSGGCYLPIEPNYPEDRIRYMINDSRVKVLLSTNEICGEINYCEDIININDKNSYKNNDENLGRTSSNENLAYVIYTSGTTGNPKGVMIEHKNLVRLIINSKHQFDFSENDIWSMFHTYCFDISVWEMYGALLYGGKLIVISKESVINTNEFLNLLKKERVTILNQVPTAFYNLMNIELSNNTSDLCLRYIIFAGEALKPELLYEWNKRYPATKLINMYGITEITVHATYKEITQKEIDENSSNIGIPIPTLTTYIMDDNLKLKPIGMIGEVCVGGDGVARGYINKESLTVEKFVNNPYKIGEKIYRSGDLARWLNDGSMEYLGRKDHQVKIRGFRIELGEIENALLALEQVKEVVVIDRDDNGEKYLCAYYRSDIELNLAEVRKYLHTKVPEYMIPAFFIKVDKMPQTQNGKLDRRTLPNPYNIINGNQSNEELLNEMETKVIKIWEDILAIDSIGVNDNFFILGGDSIKAIRLITAINKYFKSNVKIFSLYKNPTVKQICAYLQDEMTNLADEDIEKVENNINELKLSITSDEKQMTKLPKDYEDFYPMSDIELGMVYHSLKNPNEEIYHDQFIYEIENINESIIKISLEILIKKHPILRTSFNIYDFLVPIQIVHKSINYDIEIIKLDCKDELERIEYIKDYMKEDRKIIFDMSKAPIWRFKILKFSDGKQYIVFFAHHAILDGWSVATFITELAETYNKLKEDNFVFEELKCSYKQSVIEEETIKSNKEIREYWKSELSDYENKPLRFETQKNNVETLNNIDHLIDDKKYLALKNISKKQGIPIKTICFAAYIYTISMMSKDNDIVVGLVGNNRPICEDGDKILGCFLNTIPVRIKIDNKMTWEKFLKLVDNKLIDMTRYGRLTLLEIMKISNQRSEISNNILFDTLFNFIDFHVYNKVNFQNNRIMDTYIKTNTSLDFTLSNMNDELRLFIRSNDNFSKDHIENLMSYFINALDMFIYNINENINKREILTDTEIDIILNKFNDTSCKYEKYKLLHELFEEQVYKTPNKIAVVFEGEELTYTQLNEKSNQLARLLRNCGIEADSIVGIMVEPSLEMIIGIISILKAGGAFLPIDPTYPLERIEYMLNDSKTKVLLSVEKYRKNVMFNGRFVDLLDKNLFNGNLVNNIEKVNDSNSLAYVIYTSGTTGNPKGVMIKHHSLINYSKAIIDKAFLTESDETALLSSYAFDLGYTTVFTSLISGIKLHIVPENKYKEPKKLIELLKTGITYIKITPSLFSMIVNFKDDKTTFDDSKLRLIILGGESINIKDVDKFINMSGTKSISIMNHYGPTESTIGCIATLIDFNELIDFKNIIGRPLNNVKVYILDNHNNILPIGVQGELCLSGEGLAKGYLNRPELTSDKFQDNPFEAGEKIYKTGDLARLLPNGNIEFLGRVDNQVKIRGFRVEVGEVEKQILKNEYVKEACVVVREDESENKYLCAYMVTKSEVEVAEMRSYLSKSLPGYMIPSQFVKLEEMPLMGNGKVDKKLLPIPNRNVNVGSEYEAPRYKIEEKLTVIWGEILGVDRIGINDNFFDLGGHSLKAMILVNKIYKEFNIEIEIKDIFEKATIKNLANYIEKANKREYFNIEKIEMKPYYETSSAQKRMYVLQQFDFDSVVYNMPMSIVLQGDVDILKIEQAFKCLISRHEAFRTQFKIVNGQIMQFINNDIEFKLEYLEVIDENQLQQIQDQFVRPFDLGKEHLLRVNLLKIEELKYMLLIDMHHIISDERSLEIMSNEFIKFYLGEEIKPLCIQYKDYALWQNKMKQTLHYKKQETYWLDEFKGKIPELKLPTDYSKLNVDNYDGRDIQFYIGQDETKLLKQLAKNNETTMFMVLISIYAVLLSKYSGNNDIVIGVPISGRTHQDAEDIIGVFANTLPLRLKLEDNESFRHNLKSIRQKSLSAYENQDYQYEELIEKIDISRNRERKDLFNVMFIMKNNVKKYDYGNSIKINSSGFISKTAKYDITLSAIENDDKIALNFNYNTNLYSEETIKTIIKHYKNIVNEILNNEKVLLNNIELLSKEEAKAKELEIKKYIDDSTHDVEFNF